MAVILSATGVDAAEQLISEQYLAVRLRSVGDEQRFTAAQTTLGSATVGHLKYDMAVDLDAAPLGALAISHVRTGSAIYRSRGREDLWTPGQVGLAAQPEDPFSASFDDMGCDFAILDPAVLSEVAATAPYVTGPVRLLGNRAEDPQSAAALIRTLTYVRDLALILDEHPSPPLARQAARLVAVAVLAAFPSNALLEPTAQDRRDAHPTTVRRAVAFVESHPDQDITITDIARAAHVTPRALQMAFRRHLDTTPMTYLRRVRLDRAHADLLAADPTATTVAAIAARWGYTPSRFATDYRAAYGAPPHRTLRSAPPD